MKKFGLVGFPLSHSFSKKYFAEKFQKENIIDAVYDNYEIEDVSLSLKDEIVAQKGELKGLNVTIPHKQNVIPLLDELDDAAADIGAVNVIKILPDGKLKGYNSDYYGFKKSLEKFVGSSNLQNLKALILGTGGASKAVRKALEDLGIEYQYVSRNSSEGVISYDDIKEEVIKEHQLIINTTPLGMYPKVENCPALPYDNIGEGHYLYDLVYNPEETLFMKKGRDNGAKAIHGLEMLHLQAEKAWEIWND